MCTSEGFVAFGIGKSTGVQSAMLLFPLPAGLLSVAGAPVFRSAGDTYACQHNQYQHFNFCCCHNDTTLEQTATELCQMF
jgi:hypothetical protein